MMSVAQMFSFGVTNLTPLSVIHLMSSSGGKGAGPPEVNLVPSLSSPLMAPVPLVNSAPGFTLLLFNCSMKSLYEISFEVDGRANDRKMKGMSRASSAHIAHLGKVCSPGSLPGPRPSEGGGVGRSELIPTA